MVSSRPKVITFTLLTAAVLAGGFGGYILSSYLAHNDRAKLQVQINKLKAEAINASFIELKPWGVKFPLSDNSQQLIYVPLEDGIYFDSEGLAKLAGYKECGIGSSSLGALSKSTSPLTTTATANSEGLVAHVGNYYYNYFPPQACSSIKAVVDEQMKQTANLIIGLKDLFDK